MHPATRWRRTGAYEQARIRRGVRVPASHGAKDHLLQIVRATPDVAPDEVGVVSLVIGRRHFVPGDYRIAKPGCKFLDASFDPVRHVHLTPVGHMAIGPPGML